MDKIIENYGFPAHFIAADSCKFHIATRVGNYMISTVGCYLPNGIDQGAQDIGFGRKYETFVFLINGVCTCGCGQPNIIPSEIDSKVYNKPDDANKGHNELVGKYIDIMYPKPEIIEYKPPKPRYVKSKLNLRD